MTSPRRGYGDGTYREKRAGLLEYRFRLPDGRRKSVYGKTKKECQGKANEARRKHELGLSALGKGQTLAQFLDHWLSEVSRQTVRASTHERNEGIVRVHILPNLGPIRLADLTGQHLQLLYGQLLSAGLAPATVVRVHAVLHRSLRMAVRWKLIPSNPADDVDKPQLSRKEMQFLTRQQVTQLLGHASGPVFRGLYVVAATTGLRRGELLALRWSDVDFDRGILTVQRTVQRIRGEGLVFGEPKTNSGRRSVRLSELALGELRKLRVHQAERRLKAGPAWQDLDLVFASSTGTVLEAARITRTFQHDLKAASLPPIRLHDLRHTFATLALEQGVPMKAVQSALGHSTVAVTMDVYGHITPAMQDSVAETMDRLFGS